MNNYSTYPVTNDFGFTYWSLMIPPFKPEHTLILGYGEGTIAELIRLVWGDCKITGVDIMPPARTVPNVEFVLEDAQEYLREPTLLNTYDYAVVDIFTGQVVPEWVRSEEFMKNLAMTVRGRVAFNSFSACPLLPEVSQYFDISLVKELRGNQVVFARPR